MLRAFACALALAALCVSPVAAGPIDLHYDVAPNVYGSPDWAPWWSSTKSDVSGGSFTNMRSGDFPGQAKMRPREEIVYSTGDLGHRTHFVWWLPGVAEGDFGKLADGNTFELQTKFVFDYGGTTYTFDGGYAVNGPTVGWANPSDGTYEAHDGGTIGSFGWAFWATDDLAAPYDTGGSPYDETDAADIAALAEDIKQNQTFLRGMTRYRVAGETDWTMGPSAELEMAPLPTPSTLAVFAAGLAGLGAVAGRRRLKRS
jgi:hypothetical protein